MQEEFWRETDPLGAVTTYLYDKEDRVVKVTTPDDTVTEYTYNSDSNVTSITATKADGESSVLRYLYALDGSLLYSEKNTYDENGIHYLTKDVHIVPGRPIQ